MSSNGILTTGFSIDGIDGAFEPAAVTVRESIHGLRRIEVTLPGAAAGNPNDILRKGAQLSVAVDGTLVRRFEGVVFSVQERWSSKGGGGYVVGLGSPLDFLTLTTDCRIHQEKTVIDVVKLVLKEAGIPDDKVADRTTATYEKQPSITQYNETLFAFVSRILEAEGAYFFLEDGDDGLIVVLGDSADAHKPQAEAKLPFVRHQGTVTTAAVRTLTEIDTLRASKVTLADLDWQKPDLDLLAESAEKKQQKTREHYDHPGRHLTAAAGKTRALRRLESFVARASGIAATATTPAMMPGATFELTEPPRDDLGQEYVVTEARHTWSAEGGAHAWSVAFQALPKSVPFRPAQTTPRPQIKGVQTAFVTGPSGQEIHTDEHGRVKLKFHWDRHAKSLDDKTSAWVRVAEVQMSGGIAIPRIGWEVLVEFEHGDPDRPVVVGRLYNGTYLPPYALPAKKTMSSLMSYSSPNGAGHNEIRFEDAQGAEHIHMHAQKDHLLTVDNERKTHVTTGRMVTIKLDEEVTVKGNRTFEVKGLWETTVAGSQSLTVEGERKKTIKKDERVTINGNRKTTITGAHTISTEKNATIGAEGDVAATITGSLTEESVDEAASLVVGDDMSLTIAAAKNETVKKGKTATTEGKRTVTVGGALTDISGKDLALFVGGKRSSTIGAAWTVTSQKDIELSSADALEMTIGAALTATGATSIAFKVGSSKVLIGQGGVVIDSGKVKISSDGPAAVMGAIVASK
jgi:type VI secretion system secreted protein VgrG